MDVDGWMHAECMCVSWIVMMLAFKISGPLATLVGRTHFTLPSMSADCSDKLNWGYRVSVFRLSIILWSRSNVIWLNVRCRSNWLSSFTGQLLRSWKTVFVTMGGVKEIICFTSAKEQPGAVKHSTKLLVKMTNTITIIKVLLMSSV